MRAFEARCWIARAVMAPMGPIRVATDDGDAHVSLTPALESIAGQGIAGAGVTVAFDEPDDQRPDDRVVDGARELALVAVNRLVRVAFYASRRANGPHVVAPALDADDLVGFVVVETGASPRALPPRPLVIRAPVIAGAGLDATIQRYVNPTSRLNDAEVRWLDALDAAGAGRTREAVVAARASIEIAWHDTVTAACAAQKGTSPSSVHSLIDAYLALATDCNRIQEKLHLYSAGILGVSFQQRWHGQGRWQGILDAFSARNDAAHGRGSITPARALEIVILMRDVLDEIAVERARYP